MPEKQPDPRYSEMVMKSISRAYTPEDRKKLGMEPTPRTPVLDANPWKLYRLSARQKTKPLPDTAPVVVVPSLINRNYILDLLPGHSLMEALVNAGLDVFLIDWGIPGEEHGHLGLSYYTGTFLRRAIRQVKKLTGREHVQLLGQCLGGLMAAAYAAHPVLSADLQRLALLTAPLDFENTGLLSDWTKKEIFDVEKLTSPFLALVPPEFIHMSFPFLNIRATLSKYRNLLEKFELPDFPELWQALDIWGTDNIPFTLSAFRELIKSFYQDNLLMKNNYELAGEKVGVKDIDIETLAIVAEHDHVFTEKGARGIFNSNAAKKGLLTYMVKPAGHVTLIVAHPVRTEVYGDFINFFARPK